MFVRNFDALSSKFPPKCTLVCELGRPIYGDLAFLRTGTSELRFANFYIFTVLGSFLSIPKGDIRKHRSMTDSAECSLCHVAVDTLCHSLFDCQMARCVWALVDEDLTESIISNRTEDAKLWMLWLVGTLPSEELARVLVTMWAIWWARRRAIHDNQFQSPLSTLMFINKFMAELELIPEKLVRSKDLHVNSGNNSGQPPVLGWLPPDSHEVKMNVDGGFSKIGDRGASAVVREGLLDPTVLEAQACNEALALAIDLYVQSLCVA